MQGPGYFTIFTCRLRLLNNQHTSMNRSFTCKILFTRILLPAMLLLVALFTGCDKFEGSQTVPSYIHVDTLSFTTEYYLQGTPVQRFVDVWVYVDDDLIGAWQMPATIPILSEGAHKLSLMPGVLVNGMTGIRAYYPCVVPIIKPDFEFVPDSIINVTGISQYYDNASFVWMEDFEDGSLSIHPTNASDTGIYRTQPANAPGAYLDENSQFSGISYLDKTRDFLELVSDDGNGEGFYIDRGDYAVLEIQYKTDVPITVGMYITTQDLTVEDRSYIGLNPTDTWKKVYVNFTPVINETTSALDFKIYLQAGLGTTLSSAEVMLDNIKFVTRPNQ
jgi:hypothetical protein